MADGWWLMADADGWWLMLMVMLMADWRLMNDGEECGPSADGLSDNVVLLPRRLKEKMRSWE
jgi:hypothetical protein